MNEIAIVEKLRESKKMSYKYIAEKMGLATPSGVSNRLKSKTMNVETLVEMLAVMDCELIIRNKVGEKESYIVTNEDRNPVVPKKVNTK